MRQNPKKTRRDERFTHEDDEGDFKQDIEEIKKVMQVRLEFLR